MRIQSTCPANVVEITHVVQKKQQFKLYSSLFEVNIQSRPEYSVIMNQTLHNFFVDTSDVLVMNVSCPLGS